MDELSDIELMERTGRDDREAFALLVRRHQQPLLNFFSRMGAYNDAEDLVQETFVRVYRYRQQYRPQAKFTTFLYTLARRVGVDRLRRLWRVEKTQARVTEENEVTPPVVNPTGLAGLDVPAALAALPEKLRETLVLSVYQGLAYEEIAGVLGIPVGTVKSRIFTALQRLKEWFDEK